MTNPAREETNAVNECELCKHSATTEAGRCRFCGCRCVFPSVPADPVAVAPVPTSPDAVLELLPCPFDGGKAARGMFSIWCETCGVETRSDSSATSEEIIAAWNTRNSIASSRAVGDDWRKVASLRTAAGYLLSTLSHFDWPFIFSAPNNGGDQNVQRIRKAIRFLENSLAKFSAATSQVSTGTEDERADEVQRRMDAVVDAAVEWHKSDADWFDRSEALGVAIDTLLELRAPVEQPKGRIVKPAASFQPPNSCPDCAAGVPFGQDGKHISSAGVAKGEE